MNNNFNIKLSKGKMTEGIVKKHFEDVIGFNVEDVSEDKTYQKKDIDFIISTKDKRNQLTLEVKNDDRIHCSGNLFFEIGFDRKTGFCAGWWSKSEANAICFYDSVVKRGYIIDFERTKQLKALVDMGKEKQIFEYKCFWNKVDNCWGRAWLLKLNTAREYNLIIYEW